MLTAAAARCAGCPLLPRCSSMPSLCLTLTMPGLINVVLSRVMLVACEVAGGCCMGACAFAQCMGWGVGAWYFSH